MRRLNLPELFFFPYRFHLQTCNKLHVGAADELYPVRLIKFEVYMMTLVFVVYQHFV